MFIKDLCSCKEFIAGDDSVLRELFHPDKQDIKVSYSLAHATVQKDQTTREHKLKTSEVYYILEGQGLMYIDNEQKEVVSGQAVYIPPDSTQKIKNTGNADLKFLCIVEPAWRPDYEQVY